MCIWGCVQGVQGPQDLGVTSAVQGRNTTESEIRCRVCEQGSPLSTLNPNVVC